MTTMTNPNPSTIKVQPRKPEPKASGPDSVARDKAWATLRKLVQAGRSDRQIERAARRLA
jgi:hypothetical protein